MTLLVIRIRLSNLAGIHRLAIAPVSGKRRNATGSRLTLIDESRKTAAMWSEVRFNMKQTRQTVARSSALLCTPSFLVPSHSFLCHNGILLTTYNLWNSLHFRGELRVTRLWLQRFRRYFLFWLGVRHSGTSRWVSTRVQSYFTFHSASAWSSYLWSCL
jgi:hypothetical protein